MAQKADVLKEQIRVFWDRLHVSDEERQDFDSTTKSINQQTLDLVGVYIMSLFNSLLFTVLKFNIH